MICLSIIKERIIIIPSKETFNNLANIKTGNCLEQFPVQSVEKGHVSIFEMWPFIVSTPNFRAISESKGA